MRMRYAELHLHRLHGDIDITGGPLPGLNLADNAADGADGGTVALRSDGLLDDIALFYKVQFRRDKGAQGTMPGQQPEL